MAERRMFAKTIVLSDAFLDMPPTARCLYFTLSMLADDDGFVNSPRSVMRQCGATDDDAKILLAKKFIIAFETGVIVIKHWRINNYLRNDRHIDTKYKDELSKLSTDENGGYTTCLPGGIPSAYQVVDTDKVSIGKVSKLNKLNNNIYAHFEAFWSAYPIKKSKESAKKAWQKAKVDDALFEKIMISLDKAKHSPQWQKEGGQFIPYPSTWLNQKRWEDEYEGGVLDEQYNEIQF